MSVIKLTFTVPNIADVIRVYDRIKVYKSVMGEDGPFNEISTVSTQPVLELGKTQYEYTDSAGAETDFYAVSYFDSTGAVQESSLSTPSQGEADPALSILSVQELKDYYLFGVDLSDDQGNPFPNAMFENYIRSGLAWTERATGVTIAPYVYPESDPLQVSYYRQDYAKFVRLQVDKYPILSVQSIKIVLPTNQEVISFDPSWWQVTKFAGQIEILPGGGSIGVALLGQSIAWLPLLRGLTDYLPNIFRIAYTAGFEPGKVPSEIKDVIAKVAALGPLNLAGDLVVGAGVAGRSLSIDGIMSRVDTTQSATYAGYSARIAEYRREIKETIPVIKAYYRGIPMVVG